jgi:hypothetical protein
MRCGVDWEVVYEPPRARTVADKPQIVSVEMLKTPEASNQMPNRPEQISANSRFTPEQRTQVAAPKVGILFVHDNYAWIDSTPLEEAVLYGDVLTHDKGHDTYWEELQVGGSVPRDVEYDECPRGRVCYDTKTKTFHLYLDRCILKRKDLVERIICAMNLPPETSTETRLDSHYRCPGCMHRTNE